MNIYVCTCKCGCEKTTSDYICNECKNRECKGMKHIEESK